MHLCRAAKCLSPCPYSTQYIGLIFDHSSPLEIGFVHPQLLFSCLQFNCVIVCLFKVYHYVTSIFDLRVCLLWDILWHNYGYMEIN